MKVPYFVLELGDTCIFQPQNIQTDRHLELDRTGKVGSWSYPESISTQLCLNGDRHNRDFNILKVSTPFMKTCIKIIDNYNRSLDV
jgi:hypothetical protein